MPWNEAYYLSVEIGRVRSVKSVKLLMTLLFSLLSLFILLLVLKNIPYDVAISRACGESLGQCAIA
jgi:hypothetical protein